MMSKLDEDDPLLQLVGLGADVWTQLGGGDAFIAWLRSDTVTPPLWEENDAASACRPEKPAALIPDHLL